MIEQHPIFDSGAVVALFNAISLVAVAWLQYRTKRDVNEVKHDTKDQTTKIEQTQTAVSAVHEIANGRLTEALTQVDQLKQENDRLRADLLHRRSTDG